MIGNRILRELYQYKDEDTAINQLLDLLKYKDTDFLASIQCNPVDLEQCNQQELEFLTKAAALIDYFFQLNSIQVPDWLRDDRLTFQKPYYHSKRLTDFEKVKLLYTNPGPFRARNVYFDLAGIERV